MIIKKRNTVIGISVAIAVSVILVALFLSQATLIPTESMWYLFQETPQKTKVRVGFYLNINHLIPIVGLQKDHFSQNLGEQIEIEPKVFNAGPAVIDSIFSDNVDIAYIGPAPAINGYLQSNGEELRIIAGASSGGVSFVAQKDSNISSPHDFDGKRIAAPSIGNTQDISLRTIVDKFGMKTAEKGGSVYVVNAAGSDIFNLFGKNNLDGALVPEPLGTMLVQQMDGKRVFTEQEVLWSNYTFINTKDNKNGLFPSTVLVVRTEFLENNPNLVQSWLEGHIDSYNWINSNKKQSLDLFNEYFKKETGKTLPGELLTESFSNLKVEVHPMKSAILEMAKHSKDVGYISYQDKGILQGIFRLDMLDNISDQEAPQD